MSDIGVLNLQIQSNAGSAASGLGNLADALTRVKTAVGKGLSLGIVGQQVTTLAKTINEAKGTSTTIKNLTALFNAIANFSKLGKVHIDVQPFKDIKEVLDNGLSLGQAGTRQVSEGFETVAGSIQECTAEVAKFQTAMNANNGTAKLDFSMFDPAKLPLDALGTKMDETAQGMQQYGQAVQETFEIIRDAGALDTVSGIQGVAEETNALILYNENLENSWERISERIRETGSTMSEGNGGMRVFSSIEEMARELGMTVDEVRQKLSETYNTIYNGGNTVTVFSSIEEAAQTMGISIEQATEQARRNVESLYGIMNESPRIGAAQALAKVAADAQEASPAMASFRSSMDETKGGSERLTGSLKNLDRELKEKKTDTDAVSHSFGSLKQTLKDMFPHLDRIRQQFGRILMRRAITAVIRSITKAFSEGVENVYEYSKAIGSGFAPALDSAKSMISQFKNSIGAAVAPALQALIPVFNQIVSAAINVINVINQLFALLRGQSTWTRALPQATEAFEDTKKAASGAGGAVKDMLAAWDELNVLDQSGGGGGGGAASAAVADYENMFEEVGEFESWIKDLVTWLEEHLEFLHGLIAGILAALMGVPPLASIGIGLVVTGVETGYNAGYDIGANGITKENIINLCKGALESALGGFLIGYTAAGFAGGMFGIMVGFSIYMAAVMKGTQEGYRSRLFGNIDASKEEIEDFIKKTYRFEVNPVIDVLDAKIEGIDELHKQILASKIAVEMAYSIAKTQLFQDKEKNEDLTSKISQLVSETQQMIAGKKEYSIMIDVMLNGEMTAETLMATQGWDIISGIMGELGAELGERLSTGTVNKFKDKTIEDLIGATTRIAAAATQGTEKASYANASYDYREAFLNGELTENAFNSYVEGLTNLNTDTYNKAKKYIEKDIEYYQSEVNAIEQTIKEGIVDTYNGMSLDEALSYAKQELDRLTNEDVTKYGGKTRKSLINDMYEYLIGGQDEQQRNDLIKGYKKILDKDVEVASKLMKESISSIPKSYFTENLNDSVISAIAYVTGQSKETVLKATDMFNITGWDLLSNDMKENLFTVMHQNLGMAWPDAIKSVKEEYNLSVGDILEGIDWSGMESGKKKYFAELIADIFGGEEVENYVKNAGTELAEEFGEALGYGVSDDLRKLKQMIKEESEVNYKYLSQTLENWDFAAPMIETYGLEKSAKVVSEIIKQTGLNAEKVLNKWDLVAPGIDIDDPKKSLIDLNKFINNSGADIDTIIDHWQWISPAVSGIDTETSLAALKTLVSQTGLDVNTLLANWNIIAPAIDPNNTQVSLDHITELIKKYPSTWQDELAKELQTAEVKAHATGTVDVYLETTLDIMTNIKNNNATITSASATLGEKAAAIVNNAVSGLQLLGNVVQLSKELRKKGKTVSTNAAGAYGIPTGDLFIANEAGPEFVGRIGGKNTVANQGQIVEGISQGVEAANEEQNALLREQNNLLRRILEKDASVRLDASAAFGRVAQRSLEMYGSMTGG